MKIGQPFFVFRQSAAAEQVLVVFGGEVIAEGSGFLAAIAQQDSGSVGHGNDEDKGTDEEEGIEEVDHRVLLCLECPQLTAAALRAAREIEMKHEGGRVSESGQN
jgi:hypothetical protein